MGKKGRFWKNNKTLLLFAAIMQFGNGVLKVERFNTKYFNVIYGWGLFKVFLFLFQLYVEAKEVGRTHAPLPRPVIGSGVNATIGWKADKPKDSVVHDLIDGSGSVGVRHVSPFVVIGADFDRSVYNRLGHV